MVSSLKSTANFAFGMMFLLLVLVATQPPEITSALFIYIAFLGVSAFTYISAPFKSKLIGIEFRGISAIRSILYGATFGFGFWILTRLVPGASIGLPLLPGAISDQLRFFVIIFLAPIAEEMIFRGAILGYFRKNKSLIFAIIMSALLFSLAHLGAYVTGIYNYPSFVEGLSAFGQNVGSFIAAFTFGLISAWFVSKNGIKNLLFSMVFHSLLNLIVFANLSVLFSF